MALILTPRQVFEQFSPHLSIYSLYSALGKQYLGSPRGKTEVFGGVPCYVGTPTVAYDQKKALILLTDIFGVTFSNNKLLVDNFASKGYWVIIYPVVIRTIAPDYLHGDPAPPYAWNNTKFNVVAWTENHTPEVTWPPIKQVIQALKDQGVTSFAVTGYCFGGLYAIELASEQLVDVLIVAHPSQTVVPTTYETLLQKGKAPFLFEMGNEDVELSVAQQEQIDVILGGGKYAPGYKRDCWPGCPHGFAVRGDMLNAEQFAGKSGSFINSIAWLELYF
ncbi:dienelactone hydrolase family-domain-containing protein [Pisolithus thermaeus]|nr:dienelactone hydrolase family-domain-containing protein [Pisolithus croceorrhizus]KAI6164162.1 dienelactone hydrolase family-domain-containing protein [Pisolithus thermaeus]